MAWVYHQDNRLELPAAARRPGDPPKVWVYRQGNRLELSAATGRLASPFGRGAQCAHWAERGFFTDHNVK